ncbi:MAG: carbamoyltransferase, partial [bacterium]
MNVLGISAFYHDSAACLVRGGRVVAASQEERYSRVKHDRALPVNAIHACLKDSGLGLRDIDAVVFYEKPLLKFDRILESFIYSSWSGIKPFVSTMPQWLTRRLWVREEVREKTGYEGLFLCCSHHLSHAAAAFFPSPFQEAAVLTVDGVGEWATAGLGIGSGNSWTGMYEQRFPHSLGLLYAAFTSYLGFAVNDGEAKVMGLASYGQPLYREAILEEVVDLREDGSFYLNMDFFDLLSGRGMTSELFHRKFGGPPRPMGGIPGKREMDLARSVQDVTETILIRMARFAHRETGMTDLSFSGGVALNCVANGRLLREGPFERIWIQPASGDAGGALGAALAVYHLYAGGPREPDGIRDTMGGSFLGPSFRKEEIQEALWKEGLAFEEFSSDGQLCDRAANLLADGKVLGWFQGRMEFGPRALGNRSILADPRDPDKKNRLNAAVKFREPFRPFAPAVLEEESSRYFEGAVPSPYMLMAFPVREGAGMPAVTHVDGSARVQTVDGEDNPLFRLLIERFKAVTGCPAVLNTSFNVRGEPIVQSPADAIRCYLRTGMDCLVLGPFLVEGKGRTLQVCPGSAGTEDLA